MSALGWASLGLSALSLPFAMYQDYSQSKKMAKQHQYNIDMLNRTTAAQKDLFDYQFDANNQYNSPSAQMQRLQLAGLNPNLMYGNGASTGNASSSIPGVNATSNVGLPNTPDYAGAVSGISSTLNQARALDLQEKSIINDSKRTEASSALDWAKVRQQAIETIRYANKESPEYLEAIKNLRLADSQIAKTNAETVKLNKESDILDIDKEIRKLEQSNTQLLGAKLASEIAVNQQAILTAKTQADLNRATADMNRALASESRERKNYIREQTLGLRIQNQWSGVLNEAQLSVLQNTSIELGKKAESLSYDNWQKDFKNQLNKEGLFLSNNSWMTAIDQFAYNLYILFGGKPVK